VENILVECELASDLPETMADAYQLQQVVLNLLMNAEQALLQERGQGKVKIKTRVADGNRIAMEISDDGPGVPREIASRIFDPFFTTKPSGVGTRLGLSIVYGIVKQHGGEVTFENMSNGRARFVVELPEDVAEIFGHEINNPLTGILGNAELLLSHGVRLPAAHTQRLQTVVDLAVRLRETIRRLSDAWDSQSRVPKPSAPRTASGVSLF